MSGAGADVPAEHVEGSSDAVVDLLAALAYGELTAFMRLAEDAELAPTLPYTAALGRLAVAEFSHFELLRERLVTIGADRHQPLAQQLEVAELGDREASEGRRVGQGWRQLGVLGEAHERRQLPVGEGGEQIDDGVGAALDVLGRHVRPGA